MNCLGVELDQNKNKIIYLSEELVQNKEKVTSLSNSLFNMEYTCNMLQSTVESLKEKSDSNLTSQQNVTLENVPLALPSGQKMPSQEQENSMIINPSSVVKRTLSVEEKDTSTQSNENITTTSTTGNEVLSNFTISGKASS